MKKYKYSSIQYAEGYNKHDITVNDIKKAIIDVQEMDDEHGAFWVSIGSDTADSCLEVHKELGVSLTLDMELDEYFDYRAKNWQEVEELFVLFLEQKIDELISRIS